MADVTLDWKLEQIRNSSNKKHWRTRQFVRDINMQISNYRILAGKNKANYLGQYCSREANLLEKSLILALAQE
jgi:hypothetical protein